MKQKRKPYLIISSDMMLDGKRIKKCIIRQQGQSDCGVACLATVARFYGGEVSLEYLRELSGTTKQGTSMLGLLQASEKLGFDADGYEASLEDLKVIQSPVILHVTIENKLLHYVCCFGYHKGKFLLVDPAQGFMQVEEPQLLTIWRSNSLLKIVPNENFEISRERRKRKRNWIFAIVKEDLNVLATALVLGIIITVLGLSTAVFSQKLIDDILPNKDFANLRMGIALLSILILANGVLTYLRGFLLIKQGRDFMTRIVGRFYKSLLSLPQTFFDSRKTGELISRINDTGRIQSTISALLGNIIISLLVLIVSTTYTYMYSVSIGLIYSLSIPMYVLMTLYYHKKIINSHREVMVAEAQNESNYIDTIQGIETIKSFGKQKDFELQTSSFFAVLQGKAFSLNKLNLGYGFTTGLIGTLFSICIITIMAVSVMNDQLTIGQMVALLTISGNIIPTVNSLTSANVQLQSATVAFDRMFEFIDIESECQPIDFEIKKSIEDFNHLEVQNLQFRFPGRRPIITNIHFSVSKGEIIAFLGESGCGKSTILKILQKFYRPNDSIKVNSLDWDNICISSWRKIIGVVPQSIKIFNTNVINNIALSNNIDDTEKVVAMCKELRLDSFFSEFPQGYLTELGEEGVNISGGQKQLLGLARALFRKPQLLLLDEATSAMDRDTEKLILSILKKLRLKMAIILITHRIVTAKEADRIYIIEKGGISHYGSPGELLLSENMYSDYFKELLVNT